MAERARAWHHAMQARVCDRIEPWAHGTILRASRYPDYWDFNLVRVEDDAQLGVEELLAVADEALADSRHRRIDFDIAAHGDALRPAFRERGWDSMRLQWMHHDEPLPAGGPRVEVAEVPYDAVAHLRVAWHQEDSPGRDPGDYHAQAREVALLRGVRVLAVAGAEAPIGFAQIEYADSGAEITQVYIAAAHRGGGRGTALTRAAIEAAGDVEDLWIVADDEDRPKELYARLGFRPVATMLQLQRPG